MINKAILIGMLITRALKGNEYLVDCTRLIAAI